MESKKSEKANLEKRRGIFFQLGMIVALAAVLVAFEWKSYYHNDYTFGMLKTEDVPEELIPITMPEKKLATPPTPVHVLKIVPPDVEIKNDPIVADVEANPYTEVKLTDIVIPDELVPNEPLFYVKSESMPAFPGCEESTNENEKIECTNAKILEYMAKNIVYPSMAHDNGITGRVYVRFIIDQTGHASDIQILKGIGAGCDEEVIRVLNNLPVCTPGKQAGKAVRVEYKMPIRFSLKKS